LKITVIRRKSSRVISRDLTAEGYCCHNAYPQYVCTGCIQIFFHIRLLHVGFRERQRIKSGTVYQLRLMPVQHDLQRKQTKVLLF
jgi:hypothetical protein